jgi:hypothetical protein
MNSTIVESAQPNFAKFVQKNTVKNVLTDIT